MSESSSSTPALNAVICANCCRTYGEHAGDALATINEHGWKWAKNACPARFDPFHSEDVFRPIVDVEALLDSHKQLREALEAAQERFEHAPHTRTGEGGVTEHNPKNCAKCKVEKALAESKEITNGK